MDVKLKKYILNCTGVEGSAPGEFLISRGFFMQSKAYCISPNHKETPK